MAAFFISSTEYKTMEFNGGRFAFEDSLSAAKWSANDMLKEYNDVTQVFIYEINEEDCVLTPLFEATLPPQEVIFTEIL